MRPLLIFDLDGTLHKTDVLVVPAMLRAMVDMRLPKLTPADITAHFGAPAEDFIHLVLPGQPHGVIQEFRHRLRCYERAAIASTATLYQGIRDMLNLLAQDNFAMVVCSNGSKQYVDMVLDACGIRPFFAAAHGRDGHKNKTAAIADLLAEKRRPAAVVVGDSLYDLEAARENNLPCVGVSYGYDKRITRADFLAHSPAQVVDQARRCAVFAEMEQAIRVRRGDRPLIAGINGVDAAGKTVFTLALARYLRARGFHVQVIHVDDFHNPAAIRHQEPDQVRSYIAHAFDLDRLVRSVLSPCRSRKSVNSVLTVLDVPRDRMDRRIDIDIRNDTVVLVEGVLLYRPPLNAYFDLRVFLHIPFSRVQQRAEDRGDGQKGISAQAYQNKYIPVQKWYLATHSPMQQSDLVVDNSDVRAPRIVALTQTMV